MVTEKFAESSAWAQLFSARPHPSISKDVSQTISVLSAPSNAELFSIPEQLARLSSLTSAQLSKVVREDHRPHVKAALLKEVNLSSEDRSFLAAWALEERYVKPIEAAIQHLPFAEGFELYTFTAGKSSYSSFDAQFANALMLHLKPSFDTAPSDVEIRKMASYFQTLLKYLDETHDATLAWDILDEDVNYPFNVEEVASKVDLSPLMQLEVMFYLLVHTEQILEADKAHKIILLTSVLGENFDKLLPRHTSSTWDVLGRITLEASEILLDAGLSFYTRLVLNSHAPLPESLVLLALQKSAAIDLRDYTKTFVSYPTCWILYRERLRELSVQEQLIGLRALTNVASDEWENINVGVEARTAVSWAMSELLNVDRERFWGSSHTVTLLLEKNVVDERWWDLASPNSSEVRSLLDTFYEDYTYSGVTFMLPEPFLCRLWEMPGFFHAMGNPGRMLDSLASGAEDSLDLTLVYHLQKFFADTLGTNIAAWEVALSLAAEYDGSVKALVDTALALTEKS